MVCAADVLHLFCCVPRVPFAGGHLGCPVFATEEVVLLSVLLRVSWCTGMPMPLGGQNGRAMTWMDVDGIILNEIRNRL